MDADGRRVDQRAAIDFSWHVGLPVGVPPLTQWSLRDPRAENIAPVE